MASAVTGETARLEAARLDAARRAVDLVGNGMVLGLGTGDTAATAVRELGRRLAAGRLTGIAGVPTSKAARAVALEAGVPLTDFSARPILDLTIDGADEVTPVGDLLKGRGGALLHEKLAAVNSRRLVIVVDPTKLVRRLGERAPLPIEVVPFAWTTHLEFLSALGATPALRTLPGEAAPYETDDAHYIIDAHFPGGIPDPVALQDALARRPGIVETGLFLGMSPEVVVGR